MNKQNATRWAMVTFTACICCGMLGHFLSEEGAIFAVFFFALFLSLLSKASIDMEG